MNEELDFWDRELSLKGEFVEFTKKRINPEKRKEEFPTYIFDVIVPLLEQDFNIKRPFKCMDFGSGPLSNLAHGVDTGLIDVTAVDILAEDYNDLYKKHGILNYPIKPIPGSEDNLTDLFEKEAFHCVYARNSLDHTRDILLSFKNLVFLTKKDGYVILQHFVREGSKNNWSDAHRWDLDLTANGLIALNKTGQEFRLQQDCSLEFAIVSYQSVDFGRWLDIVFKKV